jgi:hypothetical protein
MSAGTMALALSQAKEGMQLWGLEEGWTLSEDLGARTLPPIAKVLLAPPRITSERGLCWHRRRLSVHCLRWVRKAFDGPWRLGQIAAFTSRDSQATLRGPTGLHHDSTRAHEMRRFSVRKSPVPLAWTLSREYVRIWSSWQREEMYK